MTIYELINYFEIQGAFIIYWWDYRVNDRVILAKGGDFESENYKINTRMLNKKINYMYAVGGVLNIEVEGDQ